MTKEIQSDYVDLIYYIKTLYRLRWPLIIFIVFGSLWGLVVSLTMPNLYKAKAIILPISSSSGFPGMGENSLGGESNTSSLIAGLMGLNKSSSTSVILSILSSQTLAEKVITRENLIAYLLKGQKLRLPKGAESLKEEAYMQRAIQILQGSHIKFLEIKERPTISINAMFGDRIIAQRVVKAYLEELDRYINENALTLAKRNRIFVEKRLTQNKAQLLSSGKDLKNFFDSYNRSRNSIDISLCNLTENTASPNDINSDACLKNGTQVVKDIPVKVYYNYALNQQKILDGINSFLATQYEISKINETKEQLTFQVIEEPSIPVFKASPHRAMICIVFFFVSLMLSTSLLLLFDNLNLLPRRFYR